MSRCKGIEMCRFAHCTARKVVADCAQSCGEMKELVVVGVVSLLSPRKEQTSLPERRRKRAHRR